MPDSSSPSVRRSAPTSLADEPLPRWLSLLLEGLRRWGRVAMLLALTAVSMLLMGFILACVACLLPESSGPLVWVLLAGVLTLLTWLLMGYALLRSLELLAGGNSASEPPGDLLTGVHSRPQVLDRIARDFASAARYEMACALLLIDVDHFRSVNAALGSRCGDALLRAIAAASQQTLRQPDLYGRFGDDEFIVFLPHTDPLGAIDVAERMRLAVERLVFDWQGTPVPARISIGVAALRPEHYTVDLMIADADEALGLAKHAGRNCVRAGGKLLSRRPSELRRP